MLKLTTESKEKLAPCSIFQQIEPQDQKEVKNEFK